MGSELSASVSGWATALAAISFTALDEWLMGLVPTMLRLWKAPASTDQDTKTLTRAEEPLSLLSQTLGSMHLSVRFSVHFRAYAAELFTARPCVAIFAGGDPPVR